MFFFVKANGSPLFRDELRLALVFFLATSALWGVLEFAATLVSHNVDSVCQAVVSFATIFDQLARLLAEQFLLWGVNGGMKASKLSLVLQGALFLRFIIGAVFVGVQRPQFDPVCVASSLVLPIGIIVLVVDMAMVMALSTKAVLAKNGSALRPELAGTNTLTFVAAGLGLWTGHSSFPWTKVYWFGCPNAIVALSAKNFVPLPLKSALKIRKTVAFDSTTHVESPTRNLQVRAFHPYNGMTRAARALPLISQPPSGQATEGIGGLPVEGELFPPMRAQTAPVRVHHKKQMSDRAFKGGKVVISKPIVQLRAEAGDFGNIPTIDLATAVMKEKERRKLRPPNPFSNVDAVLGEAPSPREIMGKLQASKRKQAPQSAVPNSNQNLLAVEEPATAMTSAVQLSPGVEEARRRSPRQPLPARHSSPVPSKDEAQTPKSAPLQAASTTAMVPLPRSTKRPPPVKPLQTKSPKESNAMPGVAVSRFSVSTMDPMTARIASSVFSPQEQKSAMAAPPPFPPPPPPRPPPRLPPPAPIDQFWVDPRTASLPRSNSVKSNIRPSRRRPPSPLVEEEQKDTKTPLQRRATVGLPNNPRARATRIFAGERGAARDQQVMFVNNEEYAAPIPAAPETEAQEGGESPSRKSMIHRPRPIPRKSTASASASAPLGTSFSPSQDDFTLLATPNLPLISPVTVKSLSQSSYGAPSPGSLSRHKTVRRTSFVPDLPAVPAEYQGQQPKIFQEAPVEAATAKVWTVVPNDQGFQTSSSDKKTQRTLCVSKFSVDTALTAEEPRSPYSSRLSVNTQSSYEETIGRNSSVVFATDFKPTRTLSLANSFSERLARQESIDSEFSMVLKMAASPPKIAPGGGEGIAAQEDGNPEEAPAMLDVSTLGSPTPPDGDTQPTAKNLAPWHHRVGEELPGFSSRLKYRRSRKLLVPRPLALYKPANVTVVVEAEPSPIEPSQEALDRIHEQLKQFDFENGDARATISEQQRMTILANLESEMGAQEFRWRMLRVDYAPGSPSTIVSSSGVNSLRSSVDISKFEIMPTNRLSASTAGGLLVAPKEDASRRLSASPDQLSKEEAPESGDDKANRRSLSASGGMSLLSVANRTISQIGSPTPPDTDESGEDSDNENMVEGAGSAKDPSAVLMPTSQVSAVASFLALDEVLNSSSEDVQGKPNTPIEFEEVSLISPKAQPPPVNHQPGEPKAAGAASVEGETIRFSLADLEQPVPRPRQVTRRPPRQSKRISALPDIVENPEPLAGKGGTLGIFQFPWGEKSDSARRIPPRMAGISGTMSSGRAWMSPPAGPLKPNPERQADYSPATAQTLLGDYQVDNGLDSYEDEDYDDGFDEATMWEIASLLESDLESSRDDLFMVDEESWEDQMPAADELSPALTQVAHVSESAKEEVFEFIPVALASESSSDIALRVPALWTGNVKDCQTTKSLGLPQPGEGAWESYLTAAPRSARVIPRVVEGPAELSSTSLWTVSSTGASTYMTGLWYAPPACLGEEAEIKASTTASSVASLVWSPSNPAKASILGLPQPDVSVWNAYTYIPQATRTVRRTTRVPQPAAIETASLWTLEPAVKPSVSTGVWRPASKAEYKPSTAAVASLWLPLTPARGTVAGLPQPETSIWNSYIPSATRTVRRTVRALLPAVIATTSLWTLSSTVEPSVSGGVWRPAPDEDNFEVTSLPASTLVPSLWLLPSATPGSALGLPQPDVQAWNAYIFPGHSVARRAPQGQRQLAIQSVAMWSAEPPRTTEMFSTRLWSLKKTTLLWAPSAAKDASIGLPQLDVQTWTAYIVLPTRSIRRKAYVLSPDAITSTSLWLPLSAVVVSQPGGVWRAKSLPAEPLRGPHPVSSLETAKGLLWSPLLTEMRSVGLPQPDVNTWNTYLLLPASRSYRKAYLPRPRMITSTSLWAPALNTAASSFGGLWKATSLLLKSRTAKPSQGPHIEAAFAVVRNLLWSQTPSKALISLGLPQPDAEFWNAYLVPASRSHRSAQVPRPVATITSTSLWLPALNTEAQSDGLWKPKPKLPHTRETKAPKKSVKIDICGMLWTPSSAAKPSTGLPQPVSEIWDSYIPSMTSSSFRRVLTSTPGPALIESRALWSPSPKAAAAQGYLWHLKETQAQERRPNAQSTTAPAVARSSPADEGLASNERATGARKAVPVLMTHEQWNSAFKDISGDVQKDAESPSERAIPPSDAPKARATGLKRSQSVKSRPFFDPSVMALVSEYPSAHETVGRSKSTSVMPSGRRISSSKASHVASSGLPDAEEPSQPAAAAARLWTRLPLVLESPDKASLWQGPRQKRADAHSLSFAHILPGPRRTAGRRIDHRHNIAPPTSFRAERQGLWDGSDR
ncbi:hypothetical protein Trco_000628 [Trichoderma cornu-damae]|uniref:Uncharacterized protein n=1 Tax=Trichoderma cornu-damae TaxID=654480 RepID=A0A9P8QWF5_9HYPO|nr:hypothetical protein Trco_000628 [Trichoderma cornu-damae]